MLHNILLLIVLLHFNLNKSVKKTVSANTPTLIKTRYSRKVVLKLLTVQMGPQQTHTSHQCVQKLCWGKFDYWLPRQCLDLMNRLSFPLAFAHIFS